MHLSILCPTNQMFELMALMSKVFYWLRNKFRRIFCKQKIGEYNPTSPHQPSRKDEEHKIVQNEKPDVRNGSTTEPSYTPGKVKTSGDNNIVKCPEPIKVSSGSEFNNGCQKAQDGTKPLVHKPYTIQIIPFLKSKLSLDYDRIYTVMYSIQNSVGSEFPIIRAPKKGCEIKLPVLGRRGRRGVCEQLLCEKIETSKLSCFYDDISLFVGNNTNPYEPDLAYIEAQKGIFIDVEVDEPYSGWERKPIHYKTNYGTIDDKRNDYFTERGWTVIRFSEKQVKEQPLSCLKRIYQLLHTMNTSIIIPQCLIDESDITLDEMWTESEAQRREQKNEREKMLGIDKFISPTDETHTSIKDYSHGRKIEKDIYERNSQQRIVSRPVEIKQEHNELKVPTRSPFPTNSDEQRRREAEQYEHPQQITTQSKPKTTPSSRGYA